MKIIIVLLGLSLTLPLFAQRVTINGNVTDAATGDVLLYAHLTDSAQRVVASSNAYGFFTIRSSKGLVNLRVSHIGYETKSLCFEAKRDTMLTVALNPAVSEMEEVVVSSNASAVEQAPIGRTNMPVGMIKAIPSFIGEPDMMKAGVSGGKEGYSTLFVRGGDRGQNLILLDGMKLYNTNHLGGFLSIFNSDIIRHVDVYKGAFPARYGGRASSVIDAYTKTGASEKISGKANLGLLYSSALLEGRLNDRFTYNAAARGSYYDLINIGAKKEYETGDGAYLGYTFFDANAKANWMINAGNRLSLNFFTAFDNQTNCSSLNNNSFDEDRRNTKNTGISLVHTGIVNPKTFIKSSVSYSSYSSIISSNQRDIENIVRTKISTEIDDLTLQSRFEITPSPHHSVKTGVEAFCPRRL